MAERDPAIDEAPRAGFGQATATFAVVSSMVGGGVMTTSGLTVAEVQSNSVMLALWIVGGVVALCGALTLAELAAAVPRAGGEYAILAEAYGPLAAFLSGWTSLLLGFAAPMAATATAAVRYLSFPIGPLSPLAERGAASFVLLGLTLIHAAGRGPAARAQGLLTVTTIAALSLFVVAGLTAGAPRWPNLIDQPPPRQGLLLNSGFSLVYIAYAYTGWNGAAYLAGEVDEPGRKLPRAILLGCGLVVGLYLGVNVVYALALPAVEVVALHRAGGDDAVTPIARLAAVQLFGRRVSGALSMGFGMLLLATLSAFVLTGPRVAFAMANAHQLPARVGRLSGREKTPAFATAILAAGALVLLWTGTFEGLIVFAGVGLSLFSLLTIAAVYVLRWRRPDLSRPFRTPGYPLVPALYLVMTSALVVAVVVKEPLTSVLAVASILAGVPFYHGWTRSALGRA